MDCLCVCLGCSASLDDWRSDCAGEGGGTFPNQGSDLSRLSFSSHWCPCRAQPEAFPICRAESVVLVGQEAWCIFLPDSGPQTIKLASLGACSAALPKQGHLFITPPTEYYLQPHSVRKPNPSILGNWIAHPTTPLIEALEQRAQTACLQS